MTNLVTFLYRFIPFQSCSNDKYHPKEDDDKAIDKAEDWVKANPIDPESLRILVADYTKCQNYAKHIIEGLKQFRIDSSSEEIIKGHLVKICEINPHIMNYLVKHLHSINAEENIRLSLTDRVCFTCPRYS